MNWFQVALQLRGSVAINIFPRVLVFAGLGFLVSLLDYFQVPVSWPILNNIVTNVVFNLVLGLLLVFRTNTAYERFWEGRKYWGMIVVDIRNLARQTWIGVAEIEPTDKQRKISILRLLVAFAIATKLELRSNSARNELETIVTPSQYLQLKNTKNPSLKLVVWIGDYLQQQHNRNCIDSNQLTSMNTLLDHLTDAFTNCDRILKTPMPLAYAIYLKRLLLIYCISLPFQGVEDWQWWTGAIVALISFVLLGIEEIGNEIEDPFGHDANDLPLDEICTSLQEQIEDLIKGEESDLLPLDNLQMVALLQNPANETHPYPSEDAVK